MIFVRIKPLAPTRAPATISTLLSMTKPAAQAAKPEKLLRSAITTGISAPPIGTTNKMPNRNAKAKRRIRVCSAEINP